MSFDPSLPRMQNILYKDVGMVLYKSDKVGLIDRAEVATTKSYYLVQVIHYTLSKF